MGRIPVYRKVGDVFVKIGEAYEEDFDWLKDERDMEIIAVYIVDELEEDYLSSEEERIYEYRAEL